MEEKSKAVKLKNKYGEEGYAKLLTQSRERTLNEICDKEAKKNIYTQPTTGGNNVFRGISYMSAHH